MSRLDFLLEDVLTHLPRYDFSEHDYRETGEIDFGRSIQIWARRRGLLQKKSYIVTVGGMYGGYASVRQARFFLWSKLLGSRDTLPNLYEVTSRLDPKKLFVAVHMRMGTDFHGPEQGEDVRGRFNIRLPLMWYLNVCESLRKIFGDEIQFHIFSDRSGPDVDEAIRRFNPGQKRQRGLTECSDLALMAMADLRVCSVSSYSLAACFLGDGPYLWYEPQLTFDKGIYTLWGHEIEQKREGSATQAAVKEVSALKRGSVGSGLIQGWPIGTVGEVPSTLVAQLEARLASKRSIGNLFMYGAVPEWALAAEGGE